MINSEIAFGDLRDLNLCAGLKFSVTQTRNYFSLYSQNITLEQEKKALSKNIYIHEILQS